MTAAPEKAPVSLETWGEIAARLGVSVRTAQRRVRQAARKGDPAPLRRRGSGPRARVEADASELDGWAERQRNETSMAHRDVCFPWRASATNGTVTDNRRAHSGGGGRSDMDTAQVTVTIDRRTLRELEALAPKLAERNAVEGSLEPPSRGAVLRAALARGLPSLRSEYNTEQHDDRGNHE